MTSHAELLESAIGGDDAALSRLVRIHHDRVYRFGRRVCRDAFDADDAVQEAFAKLATRRELMADEGALPWLLTVVRNTCLRLLRPLRRQRRAFGEQVEEADLAGAGLSPEAALERWELVRAVHAAIAELEAPYRAVLVLRDLEGLSGEETSAALGLDLAAMKTRLHRARAALREKLRPRAREPRH